MTRQSYRLRIIIIFGSATEKNDRLRIIRGLKFQGRVHIQSRSRGWGGEGTAFLGLNEYVIIVLRFSVTYRLAQGVSSDRAWVGQSWE